MLSCTLCTSKFKSIIKYIQHQKFHSSTLGTNIPCAYQTCKIKSRNYESFKQHLFRYHSKNKLCKFESCDYKRINSKKWKRHHDEHNDKRDNYICFEYCKIQKRFYNTYSYRVHVSRNHRDIDENTFCLPENQQLNENYENQCLDNVNTQDNMQQTEYSPDNLFESILTHNNIQPSLQSSSNIDFHNVASKTFFQMYLKLSTKHFVTEPIIQEIVNGVHSAFKICSDQFKSSLLNLNLSEDVKENLLTEFHQSFNSFNETHDPEQGSLRNTYNRNLSFRANENYISPARITISEKDRETPFNFTYVPILKTLEVMLNNDNVRKYCTEPNPVSNLDGYFDIQNGSRIKNSDFFMQPYTVQMVIFQDGFEVCNPIGSAKSKFKMIGIYEAFHVNCPSARRANPKSCYF